MSSVVPSPNPPDRAALLQRLRAATGPDRELDGRIMFGLFAKPCSDHGYLWPQDHPSWSFAIRLAIDPFKARHLIDGETIAWPLDGGEWLLMNSLRVPQLTASIDAALALVERTLPGWAWSVGNLAGGAQAYLMQRESRLFDGRAPAAPLAILIALLEALAAGQSASPGFGDGSTNKETSHERD